MNKTTLVTLAMVSSSALAQTGGLPPVPVTLDNFVRRRGSWDAPGGAGSRSDDASGEPWPPKPSPGPWPQATAPISLTLGTSLGPASPLRLTSSGPTRRMRVFAPRGIPCRTRRSNRRGSLRFHQVAGQSADLTGPHLEHVAEHEVQDRAILPLRAHRSLRDHPVILFRQACHSNGRASDEPLILDVSVERFLPTDMECPRNFPIS